MAFAETRTTRRSSDAGAWELADNRSLMPEQEYGRPPLSEAFSMSQLTWLVTHDVGAFTVAELALPG